MNKTCQLCTKIKEIIDEIETHSINCNIEGNISERNYNELLANLEQTYTDLQGTLIMLDS